MSGMVHFVKKMKPNDWPSDLLDLYFNIHLNGSNEQSVRKITRNFIDLVQALGLYFSCFLYSPPLPRGQWIADRCRLGSLDNLASSLGGRQGQAIVRRDIFFRSHFIYLNFRYFLLPSSSVLYHVTVLIRKCSVEHSYMSTIFIIAILNGTCSFHSGLFCRRCAVALNL